MNKQEFLAASLPYGLKAILNYAHKPIHIIDHYLYQYICDSAKDDTLFKYDLILHPLSDLTKEIEHKGEKFVPIVELEKISESKSDLLFLELRKTVGNIVIPITLLLKLIEWHFDIAGLFEKGEAIDVNSLSENPYK